jgi:homoserine kinase
VTRETREPGSAFGGTGFQSLKVRAPASTANLGPGFDCAAAALELWNELEVWQNGSGGVVEVEGEGADELPRDGQHLALRAFALFADPSEYHFRFVNRIPLQRGLGSSASAIALGLVAGAAASGSSVDPEELLARGEPLEGHADNLAAALYGGVCLSWKRGGATAATRVAEGLPLTPILAIPDERTSTRHSRSALPFTVAHDDAAANAASAALLGAAIASGDASLLRDAFDDRLHEPYRLASAPLLRELRGHLPPGAAGVTLSGSGPSVVVWAAEDDVERVAAELERTLPDTTTVLPLQVARKGATLDEP